MLIFLSILISYLIGAFPSGIILAKIYKIDIKNKGSKNTGATNVARVIGKKAGIITLILDVLKGILAVYISFTISKEIDYISIFGFFAILGHCISLPGLKGGKGIATSFGVISFINPTLGLLVFLIFLFSILITKIVSLSSIISSLFILFFGLFNIFSLDSLYYLGFALIGLLTIIRHKENIIRLINKEEKKFKFNK